MISYFGGKNRMANWIYDLIPKDIDSYIEPFSGAFWVYFNKKLNYDHVQKIRYNDTNKFMVNLYACSQDYHKMLKILEKSLSKGGFLHTDKTDPDDVKNFYRDIYFDFKNNKENTFLDDTSFNIPDYDVALKYSYLITSSFNGCWPRSAGFSGLPKGKLKLLSFINKLKDRSFQMKLDNITSFEDLDFEEFIKKYDDEKTFIYLDPPYYDEKLARANFYGVKDSFGLDTHERLANVLNNTKSRWALSYYNYDQLEDWYPRDKFYWINKEFFKSSVTFSENWKGTKGNELLILNYNPEEINNVIEKKEEPKPDDIDDFWTN